jgi:hypothetical protein
MLSFLIMSICYLVLAGVMIWMIAPYILQISDERILIYFVALSAIGITAILVAIHFLVDWIVALIMQFRFHDLFSMQTAVLLFFAYSGMRIMGIDLENGQYFKIAGKK